MICPHCASGYVRLFGEHVEVSERGVRKLGPCTAPDADKPRAREFPFAERLAAWRDRIRGMGKRVDEPKAVVVPFNEQAEREEDTDDA